MLLKRGPSVVQHLTPNSHWGKPHADSKKRASTLMHLSITHNVIPTHSEKDGGHEVESLHAVTRNPHG